MHTRNLRPAHLAKAMKLSLPEVFEIADNPRLAYGAPRLRPIGPKMRIITPPKRRFKMSFQWLGAFLRRKFGWHSAAHGSVPGRSPFTAASKHLGPRHLLRRDVKDAFPNITSERFYLEMLALSFEPDMARLLTKLLLPFGSIPQGGPASNAAFDLFFARIDGDISVALSLLNARYTRFTDGLDASFTDAANANEISRILEQNLARLGLRINERKMDKDGWQPVETERVLCGVCVNSPAGTQLPSAILARLIAKCDSLYRGARSVAAHTLVGLANRRRALQGWLNQASQADIAPVGDLQWKLNRVDALIAGALVRSGIRLRRCWYFKDKTFDDAIKHADTWRRKRLHKMVAYGGVTQMLPKYLNPIGLAR